MMNYKIILFIVLISISNVYLSATGYYRQQHEYQKSQESYINGELQHKSKDGEFYAKQGEIAPETQKPPIKHHFKHHEEYNKDDHLNQKSSHYNQQSMSAAAAAAAESNQDYIRQKSQINDDSRFSNTKFITSGQQLTGFEKSKELKHEGYVDKYNTHADNLYQKKPEPYFAMSQQKATEYHSKFLSGQKSHLHNSNHFEKFTSTDNKGIKDLTAQCYEAWKMYSLEEMNRNLEEYKSKDHLKSQPLNLQFSAQQPFHNIGHSLGVHESELHSAHEQQQSYNYANHESGRYGTESGASYGDSDDDVVIEGKRNFKRQYYL